VEDTDDYIDNVGAFSTSWENIASYYAPFYAYCVGFIINPLKCEWAVKETNWLCYSWLTPHDLEPWQKKIEGILKMDRPKTPEELRKFIVMEKNLHAPSY
jgi:hypothetical protein